jgi:anhydro-N-acetylmuramic acid kinase
MLLCGPMISQSAVPDTRYFIGIMSGTSLDGVDAALVAHTGDCFEQVDQAFVPYPSVIKRALLALHQPAINELHDAALMANSLAELYAESVLKILQQSQLPASAITAIGCHGQTIRHCPDLQDGQAYTLQIGNHARLAELTNITVIGDFRSRDIAAGGQGAPLVPAFHQAVFASLTKNRAIINIGGIANISWLPVDGQVTGFDSGPGNMLLDQWTQQHTGQAFDANGTWSASGQVNNVLLEAMLAEPYLAQAAPKSTGRDLFNQQWLAQHLHGVDDRPENIARTLLELTALSIADAIKRFCPAIDEAYVCGGGAHNGLLIERLSALIGCCIDPTDKLGVEVDWVEAVAFVWLAQRCVDGLSGNLPAVTGARGLRVLGAIYPA